MTQLEIGSRVEVWERRGQSERLCYIGVITAADKHYFQVRTDPSTLSACSFYRAGRMLQCDNARRYLRAVQS